jgi:two-component system, chemotaxis family, chemotaxis protein CheY
VPLPEQFRPHSPLCEETRDLRATTCDMSANAPRCRAGRLAPTLHGTRGEPTDAVNATTILIVDDDSDMRLYLRGCLRGLGEAAGAVIDAADGVEALRRVRADDVGLVISDMVLPRMDGMALREAIRRDSAHAHLPVLLISGESEAVCLYGPDDAFLAKPFNARELLAAVTRLMNRDLHA